MLPLSDAHFQQCVLSKLVQNSRGELGADGRGCNLGFGCHIWWLRGNWSINGSEMKKL